MAMQDSDEDQLQQQSDSNSDHDYVEIGDDNGQEEEDDEEEERDAESDAVVCETQVHKQLLVHPKDIVNENNLDRNGYEIFNVNISGTMPHRNRNQATNSHAAHQMQHQVQLMNTAESQP